VSTIRIILACALLVSAIAAPAAVAGPIDKERYLSSYGTPSAAEAEEQYYSSYSQPAPVGDTSDGMPWLPIVLPAAVAALAVAAFGATQFRRSRVGPAQRFMRSVS
jgi:hypothetical protein